MQGAGEVYCAVGGDGVGSWCCWGADLWFGRGGVRGFGVVVDEREGVGV